MVSGFADNDPGEKQLLVDAMIKETSPFGSAGMYDIHDVIDPSGTRDYIIRALEIARSGASGGLGEHRLANWPTKFWDNSHAG